MSLLTLFQFLFGGRDATLRIARSHQALWLGLLFVLAAGFAREYDGEDLLHEPWHVLIPLAASLGSSALLYFLVRGVAARRGATEPQLLSGYLDFLGLYWMTAPLALLYAIPFERFLSAPNSVRANLGLLALVAVWRVVLMIRVVAVIYNARLAAALFIVMFFADTLAAFILVATPLPIVSVMGGIRLSESEAVLHQVVWNLRALAVITWPIWAIGAATVTARRQPEWRYLRATGENHRVQPHLWAMGVAALAAWIFILPLTQPEQQLRRSVERDLRAGRIAEGLATMSAHQPGDFPPHWDPPPRVAYRERVPDLVKLQEQLDSAGVAPWVRGLYAAKFGNWLRGEDDYGGRWTEFDARELERQIGRIERLPNRVGIVQQNQDGMRFAAEQHRDDDELFGRIVKLLEEAGVENLPTTQPADSIPAQQNGEPPAEGDSP
jgi:hypothetical protein